MATRVRPGTVSFTATVDRSWSGLLLCLAVYLLATVGRIHQLFPSLGPLRPALVSAMLALALLLLDPTATERLWRVCRQRAAKCLLGLVVWVALSVPGALWQGGSFALLTDVLLKAAAMALVLAAAVRGPRDLERMGLVYFGSAAVYGAVVLARFDVTATWRMGTLYYYDANDFATLAATALPLGLYFASTPRGTALRLAALLGLGVLGVAIVRTGSRGGFLALLAVIGFLLFRLTTIRAGWRLLTAGVLAVLFAATATDAYWDQMRTIVHPEEDYNLSSQEGRLKIWKRGIGYMMSRPILGVGAGNFPTAEGTISPQAERQSYGRGVKWQAAHNSFVQVGAELGVPGLVLFVVMLASAFTGLNAAGRHSAGAARPPPAVLAQTLTASLIGYVVGAFWLSLAYTEMLYTLVGLAIGLRQIAGAARDARQAW